MARITTPTATPENIARNVLRNAAIYAEAREFVDNYLALRAVGNVTWTAQAVRFTDAKGNTGHNLRIVLRSDRIDCVPTYEFRQCVWDNGNCTSVARVRLS